MVKVMLLDVQHLLNLNKVASAASHGRQGPQVLSYALDHLDLVLVQLIRMLKNRDRLVQHGACRGEW